MVKRGQKIWEKDNNNRWQLMKVVSPSKGTKSIITQGLTKKEALIFVEGYNKAKNYKKGSISFSEHRSKK
jgi:hypothetical protein